MNTSNVRDFWLQRLYNLQAAIGETIDGLADMPAVPMRTSFENLLNNLRGFGTRQFNYFSRGAGKRAPTGFSQENALYATLEQMAFDLSVITQCAWQRRFDPDFDSALTIGDRLVQKALKPAIDARLIPGDTVGLAYLQKSSNIRVIPYANVALIAVPYSVLQFSDSDGKPVLRDYLATYHEAGHFVYWRGRMAPQNKKYPGWPLRRALDKIANTSPIWLQRWTEELFADVYGAVSGGDVMAFDFQNLEMESNRAQRLFEDDGDHPVSVLRPEIYAHVQSLKGTPNYITEYAQKRWNQRVLCKANILQEPRFFPNKVKKKLKEAELAGMHFLTSGKDYVPLGESKDKMLEVVEKVLRLLPKSGQTLVPDIPAKQPTGDIAEYLFEQKNKEILNTASRRDDADAAMIVTKEDWNANWDKWRDNLVTDAQAISPKWNHETEWLTVARAGGWTTEGPQNDGTRP